MTANRLMHSTMKVPTQLSDARVLRPLAFPNKTVRLHSTVTYEELPARIQRRMTLVSPRDADASVGRISVMSPVGRALLGHAKDSTVDVALPMGRQLSVRVLDVTSTQFNRIDEAAYA